MCSLSRLTRFQFFVRKATPVGLYQAKRALESATKHATPCKLTCSTPLRWPGLELSHAGQQRVIISSSVKTYTALQVEMLIKQSTLSPPRSSNCLVIGLVRSSGCPSCIQYFNPQTGTPSSNITTDVAVVSESTHLVWKNGMDKGSSKRSLCLTVWRVS